MKNILVFTAHPDDHICCAGTLMYLKDQGFEICEVVATGGEEGTWWDDEGQKKTNFDKNDLVKARQKELKKAGIAVPEEKVKRVKKTEKTKEPKKEDKKPKISKKSTDKPKDKVSEKK